MPLSSVSHVFMELKHVLKCRHVLERFTKDDQHQKPMMCVDSVKTLTEYSDMLENLVPISLINHYFVDVSS